MKLHPKLTDTIVAVAEEAHTGLLNPDALAVVSGAGEAQRALIAEGMRRAAWSIAAGVQFERDCGQPLNAFRVLRLSMAERFCDRADRIEKGESE